MVGEWLRRRRFEGLLEPCHDALYRFAVRLERDPVAAEDLLQHTLEVAFGRFEQLKDPAAFRTWAFRTMYRAWQDRRKKKAEILLGPEAFTTVPSLGARPDADVEQARLGAALARAFARLPSEQREAVWLVDGEGFTFAESAEILALPPGTVASRVARGRVALRQDLEPEARERGFGS